jgi:2-desacetyl-2-hydroxyethyl bacteriochlorophyllide A dehydrogenase
MLPTHATAIVFNSPKEISLVSHRLPEFGPADIVTETLYTCVSPGTELRMLAGHYGAENQFPYLPGYNSIGRVLAVGPQARGYRVGDLVSAINPKGNPDIKALYGAHASHQVLATDIDQRPVLLPEGARGLDYAVTEIASISYRGVTAARPRRGETALVIGQGMIGAFSAAWLVAAGCRVGVIDLEASRLERARGFGAANTIAAAQPDTLDRALLFTRFGADIVVEASGSTPGVTLAYQLVRQKPRMPAGQYVREPIHFFAGDWPRLVWQANYLEDVALHPHGCQISEGITTIAPGDRGIEDRHRVIEEIRRGALRSADFIDRVASPCEAADAYAGLQSRKHFSVVFDWSLLKD